MKYKILLTLLPLLALMAYRSPDFPNAIVVVLNSQSSKIMYHEKKGETDKSRAISKDAEQATLCTINDFTDHFSVYPVYYVMDTNLSLLREKKLQGILLDKNRHVINVKKLDSTDFYMVVRYVYKGEGDVSRMILWDPNFRKVKKYPASLPDNVLKDRNLSERYNFTSQNYNISYKACAEALEGKFRSMIKRDRYQ